ncbi:MAG: hypothetical protein U5S82_02165 [Gammaproteobacteria bacterium]|nr:hypothetical protein [Gammaproteobacteria bacterium]
MIYILSALAAATLFGLGTLAVYGQDALMGQVWTEYVFWWLIGTGIVLQALDAHIDLRCLWQKVVHYHAPSPCSAFNH